MISTLTEMALLISCGVLWRIVQPAGFDAGKTRLVLTTVVYYLLLPALIINVMKDAALGRQTLQFALLGSACILFGIAVSWIVGRMFKINRPRLGAIILAASYPNVTYLGLPLLNQTFGVWAESVAIQLDLFAGSPLLFTVGVIIARHFGQDDAQRQKSVFHFINSPPFWSAALAILINLTDTKVPRPVLGMIQQLGDAVIPLMLFSLGLALDWQAIKWHNFPFVVPVIVIKMVLMPLFALVLTGWLTLEGETRTAALLEMAMPSMVLGVVFCDRYKLDISVYAMAVAMTTVLSLATLPFWYEIMSRPVN